MAAAATRGGSSPARRRPWHESVDDKVRSAVRCQILTVLHNRKSLAPPHWWPRLPVVAYRLEEECFDLSSTRDEYTNATTLQLRLKNIVLLLQQRRRANRARADSATRTSSRTTTSTPVPTTMSESQTSAVAMSVQAPWNQGDRSAQALPQAVSTPVPFPASEPWIHCPSTFNHNVTGATTEFTVSRSAVSTFANHPWQSSSDQELRQTVRGQIMLFLQADKANLEQLPGIVDRLESECYRRATSREKYANPATLNSRIKNILQSYQHMRATPPTSASSVTPASYVHVPAPAPVLHSRDTNIYGQAMPAVPSYPTTEMTHQPWRPPFGSAAPDIPGTPSLPDSEPLPFEAFSEAPDTSRSNWQSSSDLGLRKSMAKRIARMLHGEASKAPADWPRRLPEIVRQLEEVCYTASASRDEYMDKSTLRARLTKVVRIVKYRRRSANSEARVETTVAAPASTTQASLPLNQSALPVYPPAAVSPAFLLPQDAGAATIIPLTDPNSVYQHTIPDEAQRLGEEVPRSYPQHPPVLAATVPERIPASTVRPEPPRPRKAQPLPRVGKALRKEMLNNIMQILLSQQTATKPKWREGLSEMARQLEEVCYRTALSREMYADTSTLENRLKKIVRLVKNRRRASSTGSRSSSTSTPSSASNVSRNAAPLVSTSIGTSDDMAFVFENADPTHAPATALPFTTDFFGPAGIISTPGRHPSLGNSAETDGVWLSSDVPRSTAHEFQP